MNVNKDLNYAFALSRQCLRILGVWPDPLVSLSEFQRPNLRFIVITCILSLYIFMPQMTNVILAWGNVSLMVEYLSSANYSLLALCKLFGTWYHGKAMINSTVDSYISILLLHICAQLMNLRTSLNNLVNELAEGSISSSIFKKGLAAITTRHEHLIRNAKTINDCYSSVLLVHMLAATFQLCFESFQVFTSTNMAYGMYECKWYNISSKDAKNLMFMVHRSTIPLRLTAGKFGTFSLEMFGTTIKTSMGYLSALLTLMD
ncbi:uncharacterized protein LOC118644668 [Monomorium pharaonis]|uniref:uncharacterized protein LOC118644668 n=1 Tax=Monomorium pharaonis TaxID=307658 RepID=UPI001746CD0C|nr:uncharacterized protein LOC118644668 [Monomorium pharaonis]